MFCYAACGVKPGPSYLRAAKNLCHCVFLSLVASRQVEPKPVAVSVLVLHMQASLVSPAMSMARVASRLVLLYYKPMASTPSSISCS